MSFEENNAELVGCLRSCMETMLEVEDRAGKAFRADIENWAREGKLRVSDYLKTLIMAGEINQEENPDE